MIFNEDVDDYVMQQKIREYTDEENWKNYVIEILVDMPDVETEIAEWVQQFTSNFCEVCEKYGYKIHSDKDIKKIFKIKQRDKKSPDFKKIF